MVETRTSGIRCNGPIWFVDDVTQCYRHRYFQAIPIAVIGLVSFSVLVVTVLPKLRKWKGLGSLSKDPAYQPLLTDESDQNSEVTLDQDDELAYQNQDANEYTRQVRSYGSIFDTTDEDQDAPADQTEEDERNSKNKIVLATVTRPASERIRVGLETLCVAAQTCLAIAAIKQPSINGEWKYTPNTPYILFGFWLYCLLLVGVRVARLNSTGPSGGLWYHSTVLYGLMWVISLVSFRSALIHPFSSASQKFNIGWFVLNCCLVLLNFSAKVGDKPPRLYVRKGIVPSNEPLASLFQLVSFSHVDQLVWQGFWKTLTLADVWELREDDHAAHVLRRFRRIKRTSGMALRMTKHFKKELFLAGCYALIFSFTIFGPAMLVKLILDYVDNPDSAPRSVAWLYATSIFAFAVVDNIANGQALFIGRRICIRMRAIIIGEVYAKALRRKVAAAAGSDEGLGSKKSDDEEKGQANIGAIINLMAIDAFKVSEICGYLHFFVGGILQIIFAVFLLYYVLDWSAFVGAAVMIAMMPVNYLFSKTFAKFQNELMQVTDRRVEKTNELLQSIRILKYFGWEKKFADGVMKIREAELHVLKKRYFLWVLGLMIWLGTPLFVTVMSFASYTVFQGKTLTAPTAFTAMTLFNIMRVPMDQLADMLSNVLQSKVSIDRIDEYLNEDETDKYNQLNRKKIIRGPNSPYIGFESASFSWTASKNVNNYNFKLKDLNIDFPVGRMTVIVGPTGSGKTSLLMALLGEMDIDQGRVFLPGGDQSREDVRPDPTTGLTETVAYCSQQAWLLNDALRNNILFASDFDEQRYNKVIEACSLKRDLEILEAGDQTEVGEKGITLSGGQKQRISLARAMYSNSKHLILDDCLSAVDSHTALAIYENCFCGEVTEGRTVILVSHNVALTIGNAAHVVVMDNGRIKAQGTPGAVVATGALGDDDLVKTSASQSASQSATRVSSTSNLVDLDKKKSKSLGKEVAKRLADSKERKAISLAGESSSSEDESPAPSKPAPKLIQEETMSTGFVDPKVYKAYVSAMGSWKLWLGIGVFLVLQLYTNVLQSWWIREWTINGMKTENMSVAAYSFGKPSKAHMFYPTELQSESSEYKHSTFYYLTIYFVVGFASLATACMRELLTFIGGLAASRQLFEELMESVLNTKTRFFDATPIGRIMNRFSKDVEGVDQDLAPMFAGLCYCLFTCLTTAMLITWITPAFLFAGIIIFATYTAIALFYLASSRELKRIDSVYKSPIYQHFGETLVGISTIRAYGDQRRFIRDNMSKIDDNNRPFFYLWVINRWLSFRADTVGACVAFGAAAFVLLSIGKVDAGLAGMSLSYALVFNDVLLWTVRLYSNVEISANSVERVLEYTTLEPEAAYMKQQDPAPLNWPSKGEISFENLSLRYAPELPLVIKDVTFKVNSFNKVGIVGRTGAGKSTIITALFRFLEADSGRIIIDGLDISSITLQDLRQSLAIIPQDPTLFVGTIRSNLDPFGQYSDTQIFEALRRVHLISEVPRAGAVEESTSSPGGENTNQFLNLSSNVTEGGSNLSQGQRQLMCLARSLLKTPKVLLLDEATASIDYETDARIQKTIREEFESTTLLTIAHRLRSIIDYDKILVLDHGQVVEYDDPHVLLSNEKSVFHDMCNKSGEVEALKQLAEDSYKTRHVL